MPQKFWTKLTTGSIVDIIAPGARATQDELTKTVAFLKQWDLQPRVAATIFGEDIFCANHDSERFVQLKNALLAKDSAAVWCLLGGYGSARLIPELAKLPAPEHTKLFIGFSDITALHIFLNQQWQWPTLHGPTARQLINGTITSDSIEFLRKIIFAEKHKLLFKNLLPLNQAAQLHQTINATLTGGNLALLQSSIGTGWQLDADNKILFLEEVHERGYRIDRMLEHLKQTGILKQVKAVIFGDFTDALEADGKSLVEPALQRFADTVDFPVLRCPGIGHDKINYALPLNTPATLVLNTVNYLDIASGVVKK